MDVLLSRGLEAYLLSLSALPQSHARRPPYLCQQSEGTEGTLLPTDPEYMRDQFFAWLALQTHKLMREAAHSSSLSGESS